ncbi:MAG: peptidoglycan DD-metalloendopeptidase family protein [Candidatus Taylorbacteria bacterium]
MKHISILVIIAIAFPLFVNPENVQAETGNKIHNYWRTQLANTVEGSGLDAPVNEAEITNWIDQSASTRSSVKSLGGTRVESLPIPVLFGIDRSDFYPDFGDSRGGGTRTHEGQDLISKTGVPIVTPTDAVVSSVGFGTSAGNYVYTSNQGGETFVYMHMDQPSRLKRGNKISRGDLIGFVGATGNANGGLSHLHFEIRKNGATDPYPRLTGSFTPQEKIDFLNAILEDSPDPEALSNLLAGYFADEFRSIIAQGVTVPPEIMIAMTNRPFAGATVAQGASGDLVLGSSGPGVKTLQTYLIQANKGPAAGVLAGAGATSYFGQLTKNALIEFQLATNISPAQGIYSTNTKSYVSQNPLSTTATTIPAVPASPSATPTLRDLSLGSSGVDVVELQKFLILMNQGPGAYALAGAGATGYFGPMTQRALAEYQTAVSISPASGNFGPITRAFIKNLPVL